MTRYTINIGDDFPLGDDGQERPARRFRLRFGAVLRILFCVAVVAIVVGHPVKVALATGLILFLRRSDWWQRVRADIRARGWLRPEAWRAQGQRWAAQYRGRCGNGHRGDHHEDRGFREFV